MENYEFTKQDYRLLKDAMDHYDHPYDFDGSVDRIKKVLDDRYKSLTFYSVSKIQLLALATLGHQIESLPKLLNLTGELEIFTDLYQPTLYKRLGVDSVGRTVVQGHFIDYLKKDMDLAGFAEMVEQNCEV